MGSRVSIAVLLLAGVALATATPAAAQQVGSATAVNQLSDATPPGNGTVTLKVGAHIVHNERIHTSPTGTVQLLFLDKSSMSIARNTSITINEYVYNPGAGGGHSLTKLTEGALRYVGGAISHEGGATVDTGAASIGIRGGTATISSGRNGTRVIDHFGIITISNGCGTLIIRRSDFATTIPNWNTCPSPPARVTDGEISHYLALLTSLPGQNGGVPGLREALIGPVGNGPNTVPVITDNGSIDAFQLTLQATQRGTSQSSSSPSSPSTQPVQTITTSPSPPQQIIITTSPSSPSITSPSFSSPSG